MLHNFAKENYLLNFSLNLAVLTRYFMENLFVGYELQAMYDKRLECYYNKYYLQKLRKYDFF